MPSDGPTARRRPRRPGAASRMNVMPWPRGAGVEPADRAVADAPLGHVEHPLDGHLVGRVDDRPQVGQRVLDLPAVVEAGAADDLVGDAGPHERAPRPPGSARWSGRRRPCRPSASRRPSCSFAISLDDPLRLVGLVVGVVADDGLAAALVGPQLLGLAAQVVGDDRVGGVEDGLGRPVVLLEHDHRGVGERLLELEDVADVGASEPIDRVVHEHAVGHVGVASDRPRGRTPGRRSRSSSTASTSARTKPPSPSGRARACRAAGG